MSQPLLELLLLLVLILVNGFFALAEFAIVSARRSRLQQMAEQGRRGAAAALDLAAQPDRFLATIQIGITLVGTLSGAFAGATLARELAAWLASAAWLAPFAEGIAVTTVVIGLTFVTLVIGELAPKQIALHAAEPIAAAIAGPMQTLARAASPLVRVLSASSNLILRLMGIRPSVEPPVTEEEIKVLMEQGMQAGVFEEAEQEMVESVFKLGEQRAGAIMTPRPQIDWIDLDFDEEAIRRRIAESRRTRFPVAQGDLDNVLGILHTKDLLVKDLAGGPTHLRDLLRPALFVPESMEALGVLERFKQTRMHIALVTDEYGTITGLITSTDILETLVGNMPSAGEPSELDAVRREDGSWLVDGKLHIEELKDLLEWDALPEGEEGIYDTVGGFVMDQVAGIPLEGAHFEWNKYRFEVVDMDGRRVDKVLVSLLPSGAAPENSPDE